MGNPKVITLLLDFLGNRDFAQHPQEHRDSDPYFKVVGLYLFRFYSLSFVTVAVSLFWLFRQKVYYHLRSTCTWQRTRPQRRRPVFLVDNKNFSFGTGTRTVKSGKGFAPPWKRPSLDSGTINQTWRLSTRFSLPVVRTSNHLCRSQNDPHQPSGPGPMDIQDLPFRKWLGGLSTQVVFNSSLANGSKWLEFNPGKDPRTKKPGKPRKTSWPRPLHRPGDTGATMTPTNTSRW